jgi:hypothetical protein
MLKVSVNSLASVMSIVLKVAQLIHASFIIKGTCNIIFFESSFSLSKNNIVNNLSFFTFSKSANTFNATGILLIASDVRSTAFDHNSLVLSTAFDQNSIVLSTALSLNCTALSLNHKAFSFNLVQSII